MTGPFVDALVQAQRPLITEVKCRDAYGADLLGGRSLAEVVRSYETAGAPCLSVVTGRWFGGRSSMVREVAEVTDRPLLHKDFITRGDQIRSSAAAGASAVLLTVDLLPRSSLARLVDVALEEGLTPFVEVVDPAGVAAIPRTDECVVAVNNKNIRHREQDGAGPDRSIELLPAVQRSGTRCAVSASGIDRPDTAALLLSRGYTGLLIGTALLRTADPSAWMDAFERSRARYGQEA